MHYRHVDTRVQIAITTVQGVDKPAESHFGYQNIIGRLALFMTVVVIINT